MPVGPLSHEAMPRLIHALCRHAVGLASIAARQREEENASGPA